MAIGTKNLNLVQTCIADVNIALLINCQSGALVYLRQLNCTQKFPRCIENLNANVAGIEHEQFTTAHHQLARESELAGTVARAALPKFANEPALVVHDKDHVPLPIADVNASRSFVDRNGGWSIEVRFSSSQFPHVAPEFSDGVVDENHSAALVDDVQIVLTIGGEGDGSVQTFAVFIQQAVFRVNKIEDVHGLSARIGYEDTLGRVCGDGRW